MKIRSVVALIGLAISFALPTFAQETKTPDPQLREKLIAAIKKHTDALDKNDAAAVAANFTEDGILVTPDGPIFGREAIESSCYPPTAGTASPATSLPAAVFSTSTATGA
jgi:hypothetical protein